MYFIALHLCLSVVKKAKHGNNWQKETLFLKGLDEIYLRLKDDFPKT